MKQCSWISGLLLLQSLAFAQDTVSPSSIGASAIGYATVQEASGGRSLCGAERI